MGLVVMEADRFAYLEWVKDRQMHMFQVNFDAKVASMKHKSL